MDIREKIILDQLKEKVLDGILKPNVDIPLTFATDSVRTNYAPVKLEMINGRLGYDNSVTGIEF